MKPKEILTGEEYANYRNVRAVSMLFVVLGAVLVLGGIAASVGDQSKSRDRIEPEIAVVLALVGLSGVVGGIAALRGNRRFAPMVYVMAALYIFGFPIGTILSIVMFRGLSGYLASVEKLKSRIEVRS
jgi:hypothetical protein